MSTVHFVCPPKTKYCKEEPVLGLGGSDQPWSEGWGVPRKVVQ